MQPPVSTKPVHIEIMSESVHAISRDHAPARMSIREGKALDGVVNIGSCSQLLEGQKGSCDLTRKMMSEKDGGSWSLESLGSAGGCAQMTF